MAKLLAAHELARLVSNVTETMFGFTVEPCGEETTLAPANSSPTEVAKQLSLEGANDYSFALSTDIAGGNSLGSVMFAIEPSEVDDETRIDSLSELVNITAGQIKNALGVDAALGLPAEVDEEELQAWHCVRLRAGAVVLCVWQKPR